MGLSCVERHARDAIKKKLGWTLTLGRSANLTRPLNGRQACHYCGPCERGCATKSYFNSAFTTVADALKTGNCTLVQNAMVYKVLMDPVTHKARGVLYIDRVTREPKEVQAKAVILSAQALESARILLNSRTEQAPNGLANSSGVLGHYLMDHLWVAGGASGEFPELAKYMKSVGQQPRPARRDLPGPLPQHEGLARTRRFLRGYGFQGGGESASFRMGAPGIRRGLQEGRPRPPGHPQPLGLRRGACPTTRTSWRSTGT